MCAFTVTVCCTFTQLLDSYMSVTYQGSVKASPTFELRHETSPSPFPPNNKSNWMPKKPKSVSEIVNAQFSASGDSGRDYEAMDAPDMDDYTEEEGSRVTLTSSGSKRGRNSKGDSAPETGKKKITFNAAPALRKRSSALGEDFNTGKYAAKPVNINEIEDKMDSIFGLLDEDDGDMDDLDGYGYSDEEGDEEDEEEDEVKPKKGRRVETEEDFHRLLEKKAASAPRRRIREDGSSLRPDGAIAATASATEQDLLLQLTQLKQRQASELKTTAEDGEEGTEGPAPSEGAFVKQLVNLFNDLAHVRVRLQPAVAHAVRFPKYNAFAEYSTAMEKLAADAHRAEEDEEDAASPPPTFQACRASLVSIISSLHPNMSEETTNLAMSSDKLFAHITAHYKASMPRIDETVQYWSNKTTSLSSAGLKAINQNLLDQIKAVVASKARLLNRAQRNRSHVSIIGDEVQAGMSPAERAAAIATGDVDEEIFDDADFVRELAHRSGSIKLKQQQDAVEAEAKAKIAEIKQKEGHRKSKGRSLDYRPRAKLVGFMAPVAFQLSAQHDALLNSLFQ